MTKAQTQSSFPSFASIICIVSVLFYCVGFIRIEMELSNQKKKINALEDALDAVKVNETFIQSSPTGKLTYS